MFKSIAILTIFSLSFLIHAADFDLSKPSTTELDKQLTTIDKETILNEKPFKYNILRKITVKGINAINEQAIRNVITVFLGDTLTPLIINRNIKRIENLGHFQNVESSIRPLDGGKEWIITVVENPTISSIEIIGNSAVSTDVIKTNLSSKIDTIFDVTSFRKDITTIKNLYSNKGFIFTKIKNKQPTNEDPSLKFYITEGKYDQISVSGNTKTKSDIITREMMTKKGDIVNQNELRTDLQRIYNLNFFSDITTDIQKSESNKDQYDLQINVKEKSTDSINVGGGWGQQGGGFFSADLNINNLFGEAKATTLRGQWGSRATTYQFKYSDPWFFGERKSMTFKAWNTSGRYGFNNLMSATRFRPERRAGTSISIGLPHNYNLRSYHKVEIEGIEVDEVDSIPAYNYSRQLYKYMITYDTRDIVFNPLNGVYYVLSIEQGFKLKQNSFKYTKLEASISHFFQTLENQTIATRINAGKLFGEKLPSNQLVYSEYYFVGGPNTVRGYPEYPDSFANGLAQLLSNVEYRFLLSDIFQFILFIDYGWASSLGNGVFSGKIGKGFGFRINSPLGPIRIDYGINEEGDGRTHINIGHIF